jgi:hypothetical protein
MVLRWSPLRRATIANLLYALLEAESTIALTAVGLDPGIGILHTDQRVRDSLALDLMKAARPSVDRYLLDLSSRNPCAAADFGETSARQCRIMPPLARRLAENHTHLGRRSSTARGTDRPSLGRERRHRASAHRTHRSIAPRQPPANRPLPVIPSSGTTQHAKVPRLRSPTIQRRETVQVVPRNRQRSAAANPTVG